MRGEHRQLSVAELIEFSVIRKEGELTSSGALSVSTGKYTGRSPRDKFIVNEPSLGQQIHWGTTNQPITRESFDRVYRKALSYLQDKETFVFDGFAGADKHYRLPIRIMNEYAWHNLFSRQLFIRPTEEELQNFQPEFTIIVVPGLKADPDEDGTYSETFILVSFEQRVVLIGGTNYAGEIKKSVFTILNFLLPSDGVLPMHCSANIGEKGDVALFFGLSGTGKTTLSADPDRHLIGDDEHGWSERGIYNFEGGCYAKCIDLTAEREPQIWNAIRYGTVLENVVFLPESRTADYHNHVLTENTRAAYPIDYIPGALSSGVAGHPDVIIFLTADASGVLPPVSKLTKDQAMYHFLSGYTSKMTGTERGITEPEAVFSACFGAPFLPRRPEVYAELLGRKIEEFNTRVYLVNTGWTGGPYGVGHRIELATTRAIVTAILSGKMEETSFTEDPVFGTQVPDQVPGVDSRFLRPRDNWQNPQRYDEKASQLADLFIRNFSKFEHMPRNVAMAGPTLKPNHLHSVSKQ